MPLHPRAHDHHDNVEHGSVNNHCSALSQQSFQSQLFRGELAPSMNLDQEIAVLSNTLFKASDSVLLFA